MESWLEESWFDLSKIREQLFKDQYIDGSLPNAIEAPDFFLTRKCNHLPDSRVSSDSGCRNCEAFWSNMLDATLPPKKNPIYMDIVSVMRGTVSGRRLWASIYIPVDDESDSG